MNLLKRVFFYSLNSFNNHIIVDLKKSIKITCRLKIDSVIWAYIRFEDKIVRSKTSLIKLLLEMV